MSEKKNDHVVNGMPEGTRHLTGNLFLVPFASIKFSDNNPRMRIEKGQSDMMDKNLSMNLRDCIKKNTLLNPLVCRWSKENDKIVPIVVGGDRRHRALDYLIKHKEKVADPRVPRFNEKGEPSNKFVGAEEAYEFVPCQIFNCSNDLDALALAWAENRNRINLTEGHEIAEVIQLRDNDASDAKIMEILQKDSKWLSDTDRLIASLDAITLADLLENRIDRNVAVELSGIDDEKTRNEVRVAAQESASETAGRKIARLVRRVEIAEQQEEIAQGALALASQPEEKQEAEEKVAKAQAESHAARRRVEQSPAPTISTRDVRQASQRITGNAPRTGNKRGPKGGVRNMRQSKIVEGRDLFQSLIRNNGECQEQGFTANIDALKLLMKMFNNIIANNPDWVSILKDHYSV